ncbi:pentatricopeptide repeat-containing protein [Hordeum vulgare]|nr:pentatricopeptide repeat-containing protein [Hordeum vulgare]
MKKPLYLIQTNPRSALLQRRRFDSALRPSPTFRGFSPASIASSLAAIPRLILLRSAGRLCPQRPFPSPSFSYHRRVADALTLAFLNWSHSDASPRKVPLRVAALPLARARALPALFSLLREHAPLVSIAALTDVIRALSEEGLPRQALAAFHRARQLRCSPDAQCYNTLLAMLCRNGRFKDARFLLDQMERPGARCKPDSYTYTVLISSAWLSSAWSSDSDMPRRSAAQRSGAAVAGVRSSLTP